MMHSKERCLRIACFIFFLNSTVKVILKELLFFCWLVSFHLSFLPSHAPFLYLWESRNVCSPKLPFLSGLNSVECNWILFNSPSLLQLQEFFIPKNPNQNPRLWAECPLQSVRTAGLAGGLCRGLLLCGFPGKVTNDEDSSSSEVAMGTPSCPLSPGQDTGDKEMLRTVRECTFDVSSHRCL